MPFAFPTSSNFISRPNICSTPATSPCRRRSRSSSPSWLTARWSAPIGVLRQGRAGWQAVRAVRSVGRRARAPSSCRRPGPRRPARHPTSSAEPGARVGDVRRRHHHVDDRDGGGACGRRVLSRRDRPGHTAACRVVVVTPARRRDGALAVRQVVLYRSVAGCDDDLGGGIVARGAHRGAAAAERRDCRDPARRDRSDQGHQPRLRSRLRHRRARRHVDDSTTAPAGGRGPGGRYRGGHGGAPAVERLSIRLDVRLRIRLVRDDPGDAGASVSVHRHSSRARGAARDAGQVTVSLGAAPGVGRVEASDASGASIADSPLAWPRRLRSA